jgi:hypothetical protein
MKNYYKVVDGVATEGAFTTYSGVSVESDWVESGDNAGIGSTWDGAVWTPPVKDVSLEQLRIERDRLLLESDFSQLSDVPHTDDEKVLWLTYRQELRDLPDGYVPTPEPVYPTKP